MNSIERKKGMREKLYWKKKWEEKKITEPRRVYIGI